MSDASSVWHFEDCVIRACRSFRIKKITFIRSEGFSGKDSVSRIALERVSGPRSKNIIEKQSHTVEQLNKALVGTEARVDNDCRFF